MAALVAVILRAPARSRSAAAANTQRRGGPENPKTPAPIGRDLLPAGLASTAGEGAAAPPPGGYGEYDALVQYVHRTWAKLARQVRST